MLPSSSRSHIASVPLGLAARAMRAVSAGMGPMAWGYIVMLLLLLSARRFRFPVSYHFYFYFHSPAESFRVARVLFIWLPCWRTRALPHPRATIKALPTPHRPPSP